jgi:hypothetical protein
MTGDHCRFSATVFELQSAERLRNGVESKGTRMPRRKRAGNPLPAAIVSLVIAGMGVYVLVQGVDATSRFYGWALIGLGLLGAVGNLALRVHYQRQDRRSAVSRGRSVGAVRNR